MAQIIHPRTLLEWRNIYYALGLVLFVLSHFKRAEVFVQSLDHLRLLNLLPLYFGGDQMMQPCLPRVPSVVETLRQQVLFRHFYSGGPRWGRERIEIARGVHKFASLKNLTPFCKGFPCEEKEHEPSCGVIVAK